MSRLNGRLIELARIIPNGAEIVYGGHAWIAPNIWISPAIVTDFETRGLVDRKDGRITVTAKGKKLLAGKGK